MKTFRWIVASLSVAVVLCSAALAEDATPKQSVLITNANIFDGRSESLAAEIDNPFIKTTGD